eukprot:TRINITY_DN16449_c0_g1_i10.p1 TRINITY_DN16449_c0_g1~~TRINITY_DN16449_c0_g1_i10.p1  ORF type:complete len:411 (+),score=98.07 TRINITY_DN16449_c0_g1_i10:1028-2260(+)
MSYQKLRAVMPDQVNHLSDQALEAIAAQDDLDTLLWWYETELHSPHVEKAITKRLERGEVPGLAYGKLVERIVSFGAIPVQLQPGHAHQLPNHTERLLLELSSDSSSILCGACLAYAGERQAVETVCYSHMSGCDGAIEHSGDQQVDGNSKHRISVQLHDLPSDITHLFFSLCSCGPANLSMFKEPYIALIDPDTGANSCRYNLVDAGTAPSAVMAVATRCPVEGWSVTALGVNSDVKCCGDYSDVRKICRRLVREGYNSVDTGHQEEIGEPGFLPALVKAADVRQKQLCLPLRTPVLVAGDCSASMQVCVMSASIIASILTGLTEASLVMFNHQLVEPPLQPKDCATAIEVSQLVHAQGQTAPAAALLRGYEERRVYNTIVVASDEEENKPVTLNATGEKVLFAELFKR